MTYEMIKAKILDHMRTCGGSLSSWYIGITNDITRRLFIEHGVNKQSDSWIYDTADNSDTARRIEQHFINLGLDGGTGGGNYTAKTVYAYRKTNKTRP